MLLSEQISRGCNFIVEAMDHVDTELEQWKPPLAQEMLAWDLEIISPYIVSHYYTISKIDETVFDFALEHTDDESQNEWVKLDQLVHKMYTQWLHIAESFAQSCQECPEHTISNFSELQDAIRNVRSAISPSYILPDGSEMAKIRDAAIAEYSTI